MSKQESPTGIEVESTPPLPTRARWRRGCRGLSATDAAGNRSATHDIGLRVVG